MRNLVAWLCVLLLGGVAACSEDADGGSGGTGGQGGVAGTTSGSTSGTGGAGATTTGTGGMGGAGGSACDPKVTDASGIGLECEKDDDCAAGYTCQEFGGVVPMQSCQILCVESCECPSGLSCVEVSDKMNTWRQCSP